MKKIIIFLVLIITNVSMMSAQEEIVNSMEMQKELYFVWIQGERIPFDDPVPASLKWTCSEDGFNKAQITIDWPKSIKSCSPIPLQDVYTWAGNDIRLHKEENDKNTNYWITKGEEKKELGVLTLYKKTNNCSVGIFSEPAPQNNKTSKSPKSPIITY